MRKKIVPMLISTLLLAVLCVRNFIFAETVVLKSGEKLEAKIIERTNDYIIIDFHGTPVTYRMYEIESIEEKLVLTDIGDEEDVDVECYVSKEFMFKMRKIPGWKFKETKNMQSIIPVLTLSFLKQSPKDSLLHSTSKCNV